MGEGEGEEVVAAVRRPTPFLSVRIASTRGRPNSGGSGDGAEEVGNGGPLREQKV